jgi:hypothetical protein
VALGLIVVTGCQDEEDPPKRILPLTLTSSAFKAGEMLPPRMTCDGFGDSPPLKWTAGPPGTAVYAVTCTDPDAPGGEFNHWVLYNVAPTITQLPEGVTPTLNAPSGSSVLVNDFEHLGYGGPCPPPPSKHKYIFRVYALDSHVTIASGASAASVRTFLQSHALASGELPSFYARKAQ